MEHLKSTPEINPYASPAGAGGYAPQLDCGVGVWRDGPLLVIHREAALPPICLKTGEAGVRWRRFDVIWTYPIDWSGRRLRLQIPMCNAAFRGYRRCWWIGVLSVAIPAILSLQAALIWAKEMPAAVVSFLIGLWVCGGLCCLVTHWMIGTPLRFVRVRGQHLWLAGASREFLNQLPVWTNGT